MQDTKHEDGFTLVELLAVILILGIIVAITIPSIERVINKTQTNADEAEIELIKDAARIYFMTDEDGMKEVKDIADGHPARVGLIKLIENGYLEDRGVNNGVSLTNKYPGTSQIIIDKSGELEFNRPPKIQKQTQK